MAEKRKDSMSDAFEFEESDGRKFICSAEAAHPGRSDGWWWFSVTPDSRNQRYAPFRTAPDDTRANVQARIVAYHDALVLRRSQPATSNHWGRRPGSGAAANGAANGAATATTESAPANGGGGNGDVSTDGVEPTE